MGKKLTAKSIEIAYPHAEDEIFDKLRLALNTNWESVEVKKGLGEALITCQDGKSDSTRLAGVVRVSNQGGITKITPEVETEITSYGGFGIILTLFLIFPLLILWLPVYYSAKSQNNKKFDKCLEALVSNLKAAHGDVVARDTEVAHDKYKSPHEAAIGEMVARR